MTVQEDLFNILEPRGDVGLEDFPDEMSIEEIVIQLLDRHATELADMVSDTMLPPPARNSLDYRAGRLDGIKWAVKLLNPKVTT